ncbi:hypothetical protein VNI00_007318 [Paramarasmius palmivorus]|uniref:PHD-type domain-containing protein n=1 Tax=Paramarasmius palmivorus TaxID=297713 RepID=A0AAW0D6D6_9AGAR
MAAENGSEDSIWGRVLICGGTDWLRLGRRDKPGANAKADEEEHPDLPEPHILRSLGNVKAKSIHTSCSGCHFVVLDTDGAAYLFGRNNFSSLGLDPSEFEYISENAPMKLSPTELGASSNTKFIHAACGRNHTLLVGSDGNVWTAGANSLGQCGQPPSAQVGGFKKVEGLTVDGQREHVIMASAEFDVVEVFAFGSGEKGQLGNGTTGERITTGNKTAFDIVDQPLLIRSLAEKTIVQIASGQQHSVALDDEGFVYVWGYNGYCRLGLGNQVDQLRPKVVPQFITEITVPKGEGNEKEKKEVGTAKFITAGPTNSVVIDKQGMYWLAGKWKNSGDGSSGSPYTTFRYLQDIMACKVTHAACGGVTHWVLTPDDSDEKPGASGTAGVMTVAWGQNASNGELGLGVDEPKSATKPTRHVPLEGIDVIQIAAGQNTTLFLARPPPPESKPGPTQTNGGANEEEEGDKWSDLPRHPEEVVDTPELCLVCGRDNGDDDSPLECEKCDNPYHLGCLNPPLKAIPDGEWFCPKCEKTPGAALRGYTAPSYAKSASGSGAPDSSAMDEDEEDGTKKGGRGKRKASSEAGKGSKKKKQ